MKIYLYKIASAFLLIVGICYYNFISIDLQKETNKKIDLARTQIKLFEKNDESILDLQKQYDRYIKNISSLASYFENDNEVILTLNKIKDICKKYNVSIDELIPRLKNTLDIPQNAIQDLPVKIERYSIELSIRGAFLNIGLLINTLSEMNYFINTMEIKSTNNKRQVEASLDMFLYRSLQNQNIYDNNINIEKIKNTVPKIPNEILSTQINWENDIFSESRLSNKKRDFENQVSFKKEYSLTQTILSKPLGAIINNKFYSLGSKIGPYLISRIDEEGVVLSGKRKSLVLEVEVDENQSVYSLDGFKKAFSNARKNNQMTFIYKGKLYSTRLNN